MADEIVAGEPYAFVIVPLVGGFLIDLINALLIELFLIWGVG